MALTDNRDGMPAGLDFEGLVDRYYNGLYQFALSLARNETEAADLTQQTFYMWATKGQQLRDATKVKSWLFTTLYRDFLKARRREDRFPHQELSEVDHELPNVSPAVIDQMNWSAVMEAFGKVDETYRPALTLFYVEDHSYQEIAEVLAVPIGTVMSRIARGKTQLQKILAESERMGQDKVVPFPPARKEQRG